MPYVRVSCSRFPWQAGLSISTTVLVIVNGYVLLPMRIVGRGNGPDVFFSFPRNAPNSQTAKAHRKYEDNLEQHKPDCTKPGCINRAGLSLQSHSDCMVVMSLSWYAPCILNISGAGVTTNLRVWFLGTALFDTIPLTPVSAK